MITLLGQLLATTPIVAALLLQQAANLPKARRVRQYPMPFVASLYAVAALVGLYVLNSGIDRALRAVFEYVPFLRGWYDTTWQYVIENTALLIVFVVIKLFLNRLFDRMLHGADFLGSSLLERIYAYDPARSMWFVLPRNGMLRIYLRVFYWASVGLTVVMMALVGTFPLWPGFAAIAFPAMAALVIGELYFAVDGRTLEEYDLNVHGENDRAERIVNYAALREALKETFPGRVVDDAVEFSSADATRVSDRLDGLSRSPHEADQLTGAYFERLRRAGRVLDMNLINASAGLMAGRSTLINNPFYGDLTPYLVFPIYHRLLQYSKCLIICGRDAIADDLVRWVAEGLEAVTGVPDLWHVGVLDGDADRNLDVGILRFADVHDLDVISSNDEFLCDVQYVIVAEPSRMLATGQVGLSLVLSRCGRTAPPVFAAFDRNHDGLVDSLSHLFKVDLTDVVAAALPHGVSAEMVWRAEGPPMHAEVLSNVTRYLGMGTEIGALALKYQVAEVDWLGADVFPVHDIMWIAGQYYSPIAAFADLDISQHALTEAIRPDPNPWALAVNENRFLIVEDEIHNVYETVRLYATRAERQSFVNLISEDYLLRDYMVDNRSIFAADPKAIPAIVPDYARTERNLIMRLILTLRAFGLSEPTLVREFELIGRNLPAVERPVPGEWRDHGWQPPVVVLLNELIRVHTRCESSRVTWEIVVESIDDDGREVRVRQVRLFAGSDLDALIDTLRPAYFVVEDEIDRRDYVGSTLRGLVHQTVLPGQFVTHAGKYYEVQSIGDDRSGGGVVLRRAADHIHGRRAYRSLGSFRVEAIRQMASTGARVTRGDVAFHHVFAQFSAHTSGYLELPSRGDLRSARRVEIDGLPVRSYFEKQMLQIRMPGTQPQLRRTIALLLNELFVTLFPHSHQHVCALATDPDRTMQDLLPALELAEGLDEECIYLVEDSPIDLGLLVAVERNWARFMEIIADYLAWQSATVQEETEAAATPVSVRFPDDSPEDLQERARVAAEQDAEGLGPARAPKPPSWIRRLWRQVSGVFRSRGTSKMDVTEDEATPEYAVPDMGAVDMPMASEASGVVIDIVERKQPEAAIQKHEEETAPAEEPHRQQSEERPDHA